MICDFAFCSSRVFFSYSIEEKEKIMFGAHSSDTVSRFLSFFFFTLKRSPFQYTLDILSSPLRFGRT